MTQHSLDNLLIADALVKARKEAGLSQRALARRSGVMQNVISKAERGGDVVLSTLWRLARALDVEILLVPREISPMVEALASSRHVGDSNAPDGSGALWAIPDGEDD